MYCDNLLLNTAPCTCIIIACIIVCLCLCCAEPLLNDLHNDTFLEQMKRSTTRHMIWYFGTQIPCQLSKFHLVLCQQTELWLFNLFIRESVILVIPEALRWANYESSNLIAWQTMKDLFDTTTMNITHLTSCIRLVRPSNAQDVSTAISVDALFRWYCIHGQTPSRSDSSQ